MTWRELRNAIDKLSKRQLDEPVMVLEPYQDLAAMLEPEDLKVAGADLVLSAEDRYPRGTVYLEC